MRSFHQLEHRAVARTDYLRVFSLQFAGKPEGEARHRRQRDKGGQFWQLAADLLNNLFDEEIAERHSRKSALAIRNRIEYRDTRLVRFDELLPAAGKDRPIATCDIALDGNSNESQRVVDPRRMEERIAAAVRRIDATAQIVPTANLVHGFVADDLFQHDRRRRPVDASQHQEAAIEPGRKQ